MRRSEITPGLIELSKKAKDLGFPQDVKEGDFVCYINAYGNQEISVVTKVVSSKAFWLGDGSYILKEDSWCLILSFSRCLEWLKEKGWLIRTEVGKEHDCHVYMQSTYVQYSQAKTHHEAIAKAVVKILKEKEDE